MTVSWFGSREQSFAENQKMAGATCSRRVRFIAFIAFLFAFFAAGSSTAQVPVLIWSSDGLPPLASPAAGHITSNDQLAAYLTSAFGSGPHTVLLFLQDKLSKDDFTVFGGAFGNKQDSAFRNLEAALQSSPSSVTLPASEWPGSSAIPALLQEKLGVSPVLVDADTLSHLSINTSVSNLLLISLPYCTGSHKSCREVLRDNDEIIGKVLSIMKAQNVPYTAIYTGLQPSRVISETSMSNQPAGRSLLQAVVPGVKAPIMFNVSSGPCIMLWAQNLNVSVSGSWIDLAAQAPSLTGSLCNSSNSLLVLSYPSGFTLSFAMSRRFYPVSGRDWFTLDSVQLQSSGFTASFVGSRNIYAPAEYSFHCQSVSSFRDTLLVPNNTNQNTTQWRLNFVDFQIQGFGLNNGTNFSYASDCAGFFTPGIWMGLLTSLLMLYIFVYGLHMIMQLNTMDRFDDPKVSVRYLLASCFRTCRQLLSSGFYSAALRRGDSFPPIMRRTGWETKCHDRKRRMSALAAMTTTSLAPYFTTYRRLRGVREDTGSLRGLQLAFRPVTRQRPLPHSSTSRTRASPESPLLGKPHSTPPHRGSKARHAQLRTAQAPGPMLTIQ